MGILKTKKKQKLALFIALGILALALIVVIIVLATKKPDGEEPLPQVDTFVVSVEVVGEECGDYGYDSVTNIHPVGTSPKYTFVPKERCGIVSLIVDGVEQRDYLTNPEIDITDQVSYVFNNISANHTVKVVFDEVTDLSGLQYETVLEGGLASDDTIYGEIVPWGESLYVFVNYPAKLTIKAKNNYALFGYYMPKETEENDIHLAVDDFNYSVAYDYSLTGADASGIPDADSKYLMQFNAEECSFLLPRVPGAIAPYLQEGLFRLHFKPCEIDLKIYSIENGSLSSMPELDTGAEDYEGSTFTLYDRYIIPAEFKDYKWYVAIRATSGKDVFESYLETPIVVKEKLTEDGENKIYFLELLPEYYANSEDSRLICLVYVID